LLTSPGYKIDFYQEFNYNTLMKEFVLLIVFFTLLILPVSAQETISKIEISGNKIVSNATIISKIKTRANQPYNDSFINEDIKNLYATGYFEDIEVEKKTTPEGVVVVFNFKEKPIVKEIAIEGPTYIRRKRLEKLIDIKDGTFLDEYKLKEAENTIEDFYHKRGFSEANVSYRINLDKDNQAQVVFFIDEKGVIRIRKIIIKGNSAFTSKRIKKLMRTKEKWLFIRRTKLKKQTLEDDVKRIDDFYKEKGFGEVKVAYSLDYIKQDVYITINITEGNRYFVGRIKVEGNKEISESIIEDVIELKVGDVYVEKIVKNEVNKIKGLYVDRGYMFADVIPIIFLNPQTQKIDVTFSIIENEIAYVERIDIKGNIKTKDKVIRRELRIYPGDKFEGEKIKKSRQRLENLGFFEEIRFDSQPGSRPNWENLIVDVKEAKTGYISFGGGYSTVDEFVGFVEWRQRNFDYKNWSTFTGGGQDLSLMASMGSLTERYDVSFTNPWIFDRPISFGFEGYKREHERDEDVGYAYEEDIRGGALKLGREFSDRLKGQVGYRFERVEIRDVAADATQALRDEEGINDLSSVELDLIFDTRDNIFSPSEGIYLGNFCQVTGGFLGGEKDFMRFSSMLSLYFPLIKKSVLEFRFHLGVAEPFDDTDKVPIYKRFFAGGASTIRGYHERKIGPIDAVTEDPIGGEALFVSNIEYTYPIIDFLKLAVFFDSGNVWEKRNDLLSGGFKSSVGLGVRLKTPLGPVSLDYGWPLNVEPGEEGKEGRFHFSISRGF